VTLLQRLRARVTPLGLIDAFGILLILAVIVSQLHPALLFSSTTITGGDTGSHFALPAYLRSTNPFNLTPWYPGWYSGMPAYTYYFIIPDILAVFASYIIPFTVAFKLVTILGSLLLPICAYIMGRLMRAPRPIPLALAFATLPFLFDASFTIDGGNLFSSMAGEYAFSLSLPLALLTVGLVARALRTHKHYWSPAIALSATLAAHVLPWFFALTAIAVLCLFELIRPTYPATETLAPAEEAKRDLYSDQSSNQLYDQSAAQYDDQPSTPHSSAVGVLPPAKQKRRWWALRLTTVIGFISFGLSAWWVLPFLATQKYTNSMGYTNIPTNNLHEIGTMLGWYNSSGGPAGDRWVIIMAGLAVTLALLVRDRLGLVLSALTALSVLAILKDPQSVIWNQRIIPFWFISVYLAAGWLVGYVLHWVCTPSTKTGKDAPEATLEDVPPPKRPLVKTASVAVILLGLASTVPALSAPLAQAIGLNVGGNQVASWAAWNYSGYEVKPAWPEFHNIVTTLEGVTRRYGCGRTMWEYSADQNRFGTPEALMTLPYWTNNCVGSMEGLFFESSATTPYHFLNQAELSLAPSNPQVGLPYGPLNVPLGIKHLQMLGVKYFIAFSPSVVATANRDPRLTYLTSTKKWPSPGATWSVYFIHHASTVTPLANTPNVVENITSRVGWLQANTNWWLSPTAWPVLLAASGPPSWPRITTPSSTITSPLPKVTITHVHTTGSQVSFTVSKVGVPVLVRVSYFPNWHASGASGPYRVSPNLMVVVPTSHTVTLAYGATAASSAGECLTIVTALLGLGLFWRSTRRKTLGYVQ
jgi:hypothetical protein